MLCCHQMCNRMAVAYRHAVAPLNRLKELSQPVSCFRHTDLHTWIVVIQRYSLSGDGKRAFSNVAVLDFCLSRLFYIRLRFWSTLQS